MGTNIHMSLSRPPSGMGVRRIDIKYIESGEK